MKLRLTLSVASLLLLNSCALTIPQKCREWKAEGDFFVTMESCKECVRTLGDSNKEAVQGCAMGRDALSLISK